MKKYTKEELNAILESHKRWLNGGDGNRADLSSADLSSADLRSADLSGATGIIDVLQFLSKFNSKDGYIVYKTFSQHYNTPEKWKIKSGEIISEVANHDRCTECGCGINVAGLEWVRKNNTKNLPIWKCLIRWEWAAGICVPYNTDGKFRCERLELLEVVEE